MAYRTLLRNLNFLKLWGAQIFSQLASNILNFALIIRVYDLAAGTRFANISVSLLILSFGLPSIFFAVFAGALVDHLDRKRVMLITNVARALLVLLFFLVEKNLVLVYVLIFIISTITQFFVPAEGAALPNVVDKKSLVSANSLFLFTIYGSFIVGYSLAGPIIGKFGVDAVYIVTSVCFAIAAILSALLPTLRAIDKSEIAIFQLMHKVRRNLRQNLSDIYRKKELLFPILQLTIAQGMTNIIIVLAPALSLLVLGTSLSNSTQILIVPAGIGMIGGAVVIGQYMRNTDKKKAIRFGLIIAGLGLIALGLSKHLPQNSLHLTIAALVLLLGFANALISVSAQTLLQLSSTEETRGRIVVMGAGVLILVYVVFQQYIFAKLALQNT